MQEKVTPTILLNDTFVVVGHARAVVKGAVAQAFTIPDTNIFFDTEDTSPWNDDPRYALCYSFAAGDIAWRLELAVSPEVVVPHALNALARALDSTVFYDHSSEPYGEEVLVFGGSADLQSAGLRYVDDQDEDGFYQLVSPPTPVGQPT